MLVNPRAGSSLACTVRARMPAMFAAASVRPAESDGVPTPCESVRGPAPGSPHPPPGSGSPPRHPRQRHVGAAGPGPLIRQGKADQEAIQGFVAANKASMAWLACSGSNRVPFTRRHQQAALRQSSVPPRLVPAASAPDVAAPGVGHPGPPQRRATAPDPVGSSTDRPALRPRWPGRLLNVN